MNKTIVSLPFRYPKTIIALALLVGAFFIAQFCQAQENSGPKPARPAMKLGIVIHSSDAETVWNAFRFGGFALKQGDTVKVFLVAKGVECESLDTDKFKVTEMMKAFVKQGGQILACGTCLKIRQSQGTELCPLSSLQDLYNIVRESDKVLTF